jgi:hypothetical protein
MKMKNFLKFRMIAIASLLLASITVNHAQVTNAQLATRPAYTYTPFNAANYDNSNTETATVGAQMPYNVERDADVNGSFFNASTFKWSWTGLTGVKDISTSTAITDGTETSSNFVVATMPVAAGSATLSTSEVSKPKFGTGCDGTATTVTITVVDKPSFSLASGSIGGCTATAQNLNVTLTGTAPFYVDYEISAVGIDGSTVVGSTKTYNATLAATDKLLIDPSQLADVAGVATPKSGKYTVTVKKVWDKNSWKAINAASLAVAPTTNTYDIYVYPTPTTSPIQHIRNL